MDLALGKRQEDCRGQVLKMEDSKDIVYTTEEAIKFLRISRPTYLKLIHSGLIRAVKAGKGWRVLRSELDRLVGV